MNIAVGNAVFAGRYGFTAHKQNKDGSITFTAHEEVAYTPSQKELDELGDRFVQNLKAEGWTIGIVKNTAKENDYGARSTHSVRAKHKTLIIAGN
jgi:predicted short-subunit dehydrogenase-like oxidoreductase (DUF2520 family)